MEEHHVVLTIPWITEYLAMLDFLTLRLSYYMSVHKILFQLYKNYNHYGKHSSYTISLVKFSLGWLFELSHFPDTDFFNEMCKTANIDTHFTKKKVKEKMLDDLEIVDQNILYMFCPYLEEIKKLLLTDVSNNHVTVKHITPVTTIQSAEEISKKKIEVSKCQQKYRVELKLNEQYLFLFI